MSTSVLVSSLPRRSPESQGVASSAIRAFVEAVDQQIRTLHSFMLVCHGSVVAEGWWKPEAADVPHVMHSVSKSFTSTAVGLVIDEGKVQLDDPVLKFFPEDAPEQPSENLRAMRVRDLLCMGTGHEKEPGLRDSETTWVQAFLAHPVPRSPGTHFVYNSAATYMLSAIVQKVTGQTVLDYLLPRLFEPLGIAAPTWGTSPQGITFGGWGLFLRTEDLAKFGHLYLQKGQWQGKQLVPEWWVELATAWQIDNSSMGNIDWKQGYGFQFWRCQHGAYRGDGMHGQYCIVLPEQDAVISITSDLRDMQAPLNLIWDLLLPALGPLILPEDSEAQTALKETLAHLTVERGE